MVSKKSSVKKLAQAKTYSPLVC